jgi:hypothetical protein
MRVGCKSLAILLWACGAVFAQMAKGPVNLDFKEGEPGQVPKGWLNPTRTTGFPAAATEQCSRPGARCAVLRSEPAASPAPFGNPMQALDATAYRNKQIRFRASVRVETAGGGRAQLWVRVDRGNGQMGFFDNMGDRRITSAEWRPYEIAGEVSEDATGIFFGMMLVGAGAVRLRPPLPPER